ncbi:hypothetical protein J4526_03715 [Desulfurococcaceae archaeon MEX13E-LK6-19]|nr:hypothetical protein J4526_03715 [Desulfurococcaceae archaeon MEX13E-LK6-19]
MQNLLSRMILLILLFSIVVPVHSVSNNTTGASMLDDIDFAYAINWSRTYSSKLQYTCIDDFNGDGVCDITIFIGTSGGWFKDVEFVDPLTNKTLMKYVSNDETKMYVYAPINDVNHNGYPEVMIIYANNTLLKVVLLEPGTNTIVYERRHPIDIKGVLYSFTSNRIVYNDTVEFTLLSTSRVDYKTRTYIFKINATNGDLLDIKVYDNVIYTIWYNNQPIDVDGDGLADTRSPSPVVKAYFTSSDNGINTVVEVSDINGLWSWNTSKTGYYIAFSAFTYNTSHGEVVTIRYNRLDIIHKTYNEMLFETHDLYNGTPLYAISYDLRRYGIYSILLFRDYLILLVVDNDAGEARIDIYDSYTGVLEKTINMGTISSGEIFTGANIGDLWGDNIGDLLVSIGDKLYLVSTNGSIDYLGRMNGEIFLRNKNTVIHDNESRLYLVEVKINDYTYKLYAITLRENSTITPPELTITKPKNNTLLETPFTVKTVVEGEYMEVPVLEIYSNDGKLVLRKEMTLLEDNIFTTTVETLSDGNYTIIARTGDYTSKPVVIRVDNTPPRILVISPKNKSYVRDEVLLKAFVGDDNLANITVSINNTVITKLSKTEVQQLLHDNILEQRIDFSKLPDGVYCLEIKAADLLGHETTARIILYKDITPPTITITLPDVVGINNIDVVGKKYSEQDYYVNITVKDNIRVDKIIVIVNNKVITTHYSINRIENIHVGFRLKPGFNNITIIAYDAGGNSESKTNIIYLNTMDPVIESFEASVDGKTITYKVKALVETNFSRLSLIKIKLYKETPNEPELIYSKNIPVDDTLEYTLEDEITVQEDGKYILEITVIDVTGNNKIVQKQLVVDTTPPVIEIKDTKLEDNKYMIEWNIYDEVSGIKQILLYVDGKPIDVTGKTIYTIELEPGTHNITIIAIDNNGNKAVKQLPQVTIEEENIIEEITKNPTLLAKAAILLVLIILAIYRIKTR